MQRGGLERNLGGSLAPHPKWMDFELHLEVKHGFQALMRGSGPSEGPRPKPRLSHRSRSPPAEGRVALFRSVSTVPCRALE